MMKDRILKLKLTEFYLRNFWYPQMEVDVLSKYRMSSVPKLLTDIDVLGLFPDDTGMFQSILGDCKTLKGQSPITRSFWMKGLMEYTSSQKGIIILTKLVEKEHQLTSSFLNIQLLSDEDFKLYSEATTDYTIELKSALANIESWDLLFATGKRFPNLDEIINFSKSKFWNQNNSNYQLRAGLALLKMYKGEFNPEHRLHLAVVLNHISLISIAINQTITILFNRYLSPKSKQELDSDLKVFIYGGVENYEFLNELRRKYTGNYEQENDLTLPKWNDFIELMRLTFENPKGFMYVPLLLKEVAFEFLSPNSEEYDYSSAIVKKDKHIKNFAIRVSDYILKACSLPPEFFEIYSTRIASIK